MENSEFDPQRKNEFEEVEIDALGEIVDEVYELARIFAELKLNQINNEQKITKQKSKVSSGIKISTFCEINHVTRKYFIELEFDGDAKLVTVSEEGVAPEVGMFSIEKDSEGEYLLDKRQLENYSVGNMLDILSSARNDYRAAVKDTKEG